MFDTGFDSGTGSMALGRRVSIGLQSGRPTVPANVVLSVFVAKCK
jgi:hypothetical protein